MTGGERRGPIPVASADEDPNVEPMACASPPCLMHELDPAWRGPLAAGEIASLLADLVAAEFAAAGLLRRADEHGDLVPVAACDAMAAQARQRARELCAVIRGPEGTTGCAPGAMLGAEPPTDGVSARLQAVVDLRRKAIGRVRDALPRIADPGLHETLSGTFAALEGDLAQVRSWLAEASGTGAAQA